MKQVDSYNLFQSNKNLRAYQGESYNGLPVMESIGTYVKQYLDRAHETIQRAWRAYPRLLAIRVDPRYPADWTSFDSQDIQRFIRSLKEQIKHDRIRAQRNLNRAHDSGLYYVWAKEYGAGGRPHYHCLLMFNGDAYHTVGSYNSENENMYRRVTNAWASALGVSYHEAKGLVHIPENCIYRPNRRDGETAINDLFQRTSYLCKADTKRFGDGGHAFGCSRA